MPNEMKIKLLNLKHSNTVNTMLYYIENKSIDGVKYEWIFMFVPGSKLDKT